MRPSLTSSNRASAPRTGALLFHHAATAFMQIDLRHLRHLASFLNASLPCGCEPFLPALVHISNLELVLYHLKETPSHRAASAHGLYCGCTFSNTLYHAFSPRILLPSTLPSSYWRPVPLTSPSPEPKLLSTLQLTCTCFRPNYPAFGHTRSLGAPFSTYSSHGAPNTARS